MMDPLATEGTVSREPEGPHEAEALTLIKPFGLSPYLSPISLLEFHHPRDACR